MRNRRAGEAAHCDPAAVRPGATVQASVTAAVRFRKVRRHHRCRWQARGSARRHRRPELFRDQSHSPRPQKLPLRAPRKTSWRSNETSCQLATCEREDRSPVQEEGGVRDGERRGHDKTLFKIAKSGTVLPSTQHRLNQLIEACPLTGRQWVKAQTDHMEPSSSITNVFDDA